MSCSETLNNAFLKISFISVLMVALGLHCGLWAFSSPGERSVLLSTVASLLPGTGSRCVAFRSCRRRAPWLWRMRFVAPQQVESSRTKGGSHVLCTGSWIHTQGCPATWNCEPWSRIMKGSGPRTVHTEEQSRVNPAQPWMLTHLPWVQIKEKTT